MTALSCYSGRGVRHLALSRFLQKRQPILKGYHIPETVANLCFGGMFRNRLYICGSTSLYAVYTSATGAMKP